MSVTDTWPGRYSVVTVVLLIKKGKSPHPSAPFPQIEGDGWTSLAPLQHGVSPMQEHPCQCRPAPSMCPRVCPLLSFRIGLKQLGGSSSSVTHMLRCCVREHLLCTGCVVPCPGCRCNLPSAVDQLGVDCDAIAQAPPVTLPATAFLGVCGVAA